MRVRLLSDAHGPLAQLAEQFPLKESVTGSTPVRLTMDKSRILSWAKFFVGWPLSIISLGFLARLILNQTSRLNVDFQYLNPAVLISGILMFFLYFLLRSFLWGETIKPSKINFLENTYRFSLSEIKRYTPGSIWSFLSRGALFKEVGVDNKTVGKAIITDIQLVIIGCGAVSLFALNWIFQAPEELRAKLIGLLPLSIILIIIYFVATGSFYTKKYGGMLIQNLILPGYKSNEKIKFMVLAVITYAVFGIANYLVFLSLFNFDPRFAIALPAFFTFALLVGYLSFITPTGLGIRELVVTLGLSQIMFTNDASAVSIYTRIVLVVSEIGFLVLVFIWRNLSKN